MPDFTRRDFLKTTAIVAATAAVAPEVQGQPASAPAPGPRPLSSALQQIDSDFSVRRC